MFINKVISFKNSWEQITKNNQRELKEVLDALNVCLSIPSIKPDEINSSRSSVRGVWEKTLCDRGWQIVDRTYYSSDGRKIHIGNMGPIKKGLSAKIPFGHFDSLSVWIFQQSSLAVKHGLIRLPVMFVPIRECRNRIEDSLLTRSSFEMYQGQIEMLAPLSHQHPFLIIGYSDQAIIGDPEIIEIEADPYVDNAHKIIDRFIEFPPEYHQAGLGILNYFSTYLREQYPNELATVKIEQQGMNVRLIIETESGKSEILEKALHEYELIVTGAEPPEKFSSNDKLILELKNELRFAQVRLDFQQDLIGVQNNRIDQLLNIIGDGLSSKQTLSLDFRPIISATNIMQFNQDVSLALGALSELLNRLPSSSEAHLAFADLEGSLEAIEKNTDPESVRKSPAMSKFKRLIDKACESGNEISDAIEKIESGWEVFKDLANKYNKVADWCGLPQVPSIIIN
ncbi:MAG: hypothetical protein ACXV8U_01495 [Methylobacter sp.]